VLECGSALPLLNQQSNRKSVVFKRHSDHSHRMSEPATTWPHAPTHQLSTGGTYFITAGTYAKAHHFRSPRRLDVLQRGLLTVARDFSWNWKLGQSSRITTTLLLILRITREAQRVCLKCSVCFTLVLPVGLTNSTIRPGGKCGTTSGIRS